jgi:hypothetical protein
MPVDFQRRVRLTGNQGWVVGRQPRLGAPFKPFFGLSGVSQHSMRLFFVITTANSTAIRNSRGAQDDKVTSRYFPALKPRLPWAEATGSRHRRGETS